jgi:hypothetical protein
MVGPDSARDEVQSRRYRAVVSLHVEHLRQQTGEPAVSAIVNCRCGRLILPLDDACVIESSNDMAIVLESPWHLQDKFKRT